MITERLVSGRRPTYSGGPPVAGYVTEGDGPSRRRGVMLRRADSRQRGTAVAPQRPTRARAGKCAAKRGATREVQATPPAAPERRLVDIDSWAMLLERLVEAPE